MAPGMMPQKRCLPGLLALLQEAVDAGRGEEVKGLGNGPSSLAATSATVTCAPPLGSLGDSSQYALVTP